MGNSPRNSENEFENALNFISKMSSYLNDNKEEIKIFFENKNDLKVKIQDFNLNYSKYKNLERFSVPIIGKISSGKSTILNFILDLKEKLQVKTNTTTIFVCLIRHNKLLKNKDPLIYNVEFIPRAVDIIIIILKKVI